MVGIKKVAAIKDDDAVLVERSRSGDDQAFATLYFRYARYVAGIVYGIVHNQEEVDDLCQEIFAIVHEKLPGLREPAFFKTWLVTITVRHTRRRLNTRRRRRFFQLQFQAEPRQEMVDPRERPLNRDLKTVMEEVPPKFLIPWALQRLENLPLDEVAAACEVSVATAKRRVARAEAMMKRKYDAV